MEKSCQGRRGEGREKGRTRGWRSGINRIREARVSGMEGGTEKNK
jgi:hypothetical protein